jgi:CubicO group peptidase (beta-lactamase class C family)
MVTPSETSANAAVLSAMRELIASGREQGVQFAIYDHGRLVVDAWAGLANPLTGAPVEADTLFPVFSVTKGITSTIVHQLVEKGRLSYSERIADRWPAFAANGKGDITLDQALRHTSGLSQLPGTLTFKEMLDWDAACAAVAQMTPETAPGEVYCYHAKTFGWIVGRIIELAGGRSFSQIVQEDIANPLRTETLHVGLRESYQYPIALLEEENISPVAPKPFDEVCDLPARDVPNPMAMNMPEMHRACLPSSNGLMNARVIARHYASLLPQGVDGITLLKPSSISLATAWETHKDPDGLEVTRGLGYHLFDLPDGSKAFGHGGFGGAAGFVSPGSGLAVGYARNKLGAEGCWGPLLETYLQSKRRD